MASIWLAEMNAYDTALKAEKTLRFSSAGYATGAAPTSDPTLDSRITFTRSSSATRVNASGLIESVAANQPRFDYDPVTRAIKGLLIEEQRTNELLNSLIDGTNLSTQSITTSASARTLSFYGTGTVTLSGTHSATVVGAGAYPTRTTYTYTPTAGTLTLTVSGEVKFGQNEVGSFATSFIPTAGAQATRAADIATMTGTNFSSWYNQSEGSLFAEAAFAEAPLVGSNRFTSSAAVNDATVNNYIGIGYSVVPGSSARYINPEIYSGGAVQTAFLNTNISANQFYKSVITYKLNNANSSTTGGINSDDTACTIPTVTRLIIGSGRGGACLNGHIKRIAYWPWRLTNAELQAVSSGAELPAGYTLDLNFCGDAHAAYEPRIKNPATLRRDCFAAGRTAGQSRVGYGALELVNNDGGLDDLAGYGLDGRALTLILGTATPGAAPTWTTVMTGTVEQPEVSWDRILLRLRDRLAELDKPACPNTYAGSNSLPNGLEGVAGDLKGTRKPRLYGTVYNIAPPCVNTSRLIYQVSEQAINTVSAAYDRGAALTKGADYTSQNDMETNAPAAGNFRVWPAGGCIRLGSTPAGMITCDAVQGAAAGNRTAAQILKQLALDAGIASGDISSADVTALDTANSAEVGIWLADETVLQAMDAIAGSVGAWYGFDRLGDLRMARLEAPGGTPAATLTESDVVKIERVASNDEGRGVPAWRYTLGYQRYYSVQDSDLAGSVTDARRAELRKQERTAEATDSAIKTAHLLASELTGSTLLIDATAAQTEATRRLNLYKAERAMYSVRAGLDATTLAAIDLGCVVRLQVDRFGMSAGKDFRVIGFTADYRLSILDLTLWG